MELALAPNGVVPEANVLHIWDRDIYCILMNIHDYMCVYIYIYIYMYIYIGLYTQIN